MSSCQMACVVETAIELVVEIVKAEIVAVVAISSRSRDRAVEQ